MDLLHANGLLRVSHQLRGTLSFPPSTPDSKVISLHALEQCVTATLVPPAYHV